MNRVISAIVVSFLLSPFLSFGQDGDNNPATLINEIKKQGNHIFAEFTSVDIEEARKNAFDILALNVDTFLQEQPASSHHPNNIDSIVDAHEEIIARRGELFRVFIYIPKQKLFFQAVSAKTEQKAVPVEPKDLTDEEIRMLSVLKFAEIEQFIVTLSSAGLIDEYGKYSSLPKDKPCYIFVYDKTGRIVAWLKQASNIQINLKNGTEDNVQTYKSCGCFWFHFKK